MRRARRVHGATVHGSWHYFGRRVRARDATRATTPWHRACRASATLFAVDLFNEGVDLPEVDTILLLRPTESALIFLQQLGRGLRRHERKDC